MDWVLYMVRTISEQLIENRNHAGGIVMVRQFQMELAGEPFATVS